MANLTLFGSVEVSRTWWVEWTLRELGLQFHNEPQGHLDPVWKAPAYLGDQSQWPRALNQRW